VAHYARIIAVSLGCEAAWTETLFRAAPLHDVGKIAIPDAVLRKPGRLTRREYEVMKTHAEHGARIVDAIIGNFRLGALPFVEMLRHVAELHHEAVDGSGYPRGLLGEAIPLEARIVAVADVFDALASSRVYKAAWPNVRAFATLRRLAGRTLDPACVGALAARREDVEAIQARFADRPDGGRRPPRGRRSTDPSSCGAGRGSFRQGRAP
jgi:HD-GYP domain-containing protein (c-di-GMP phosphodiesterase class II)